MYNSFGVIQNNFQKRLTVKHKFMFSYHRHSTVDFCLFPFMFLVRSEQPRHTQHTVHLKRTARNTRTLCSKRCHSEVLPLCYSSVAHFLSRSQQVQNKVTTRFNKLIYILFKDVQCTFCLIQGSRVSRNFYLHMYRPRTAVMSEDARAAVSLLLAEHVSQTPNSETTLRDHRGISRERSPQRRTRKGKGKVKGAETSTLFLGRLWRWWWCALFAGFPFIVHEALAHKVPGL